MGSGKSKIKVFMFPWLAHGHISPFLELAKALYKRNFEVYLCSSLTNLCCIEKQLTKEGCGDSIKLVKLHVPTFPDLPSEYHTTKNLPPHLMPTLKRALDLSSPNFAKILETLKPDILIYDFLQPWAPIIASQYKIPAVVFITSSAAMTSLGLHYIKNPRTKFPFPNIYLHDGEGDKIAHLAQPRKRDHENEKRYVKCFENSSGIVLVKSSRDMEGKYIDYLSILVGKKIVPVGSLVQCHVNEHNDDMEMLHWLDKKELNSTVFVSFGSEYFLTKEEMNEIAFGLELSGVNFIWVVRFPMGEKISVEEALPNGFFEKIEGRGIVISGWAPQVKILKHHNIGGFVSHCGWSSVMEGINYNVPIIALPMNIDQPINARVLEEIGVGVEAKRDKHEMLQREEIAKMIREVVKGKTGGDLKKREMELSEKIRVKEENVLDDVAKELTAIYGMCW